MQLGKMYLVKEFFWILFPTKELASLVKGRPGGIPSWRKQAYQDAKWYSELLSERSKCNVGVVETNTYVVLLEADEDYCKLLDCNGNIGWISCSDFSRYFERVKAKQ